MPRSALKQCRSKLGKRETSDPPSRHSKGGHLYYHRSTGHDPRQSHQHLALSARLPTTMHGARELAAAGGLMSYAANYEDLFRRGAEHIDKILRGTKPADIPVEQPTTFDLVINLTTAKALGL